MILDALKKPETIRKAEFWGGTILYLILILTLLTTGLEDSPKARFDRVRLPFSYYENYIFPNLIRYTVIYAAFLLLNFRLIAKVPTRDGLFAQAFFIFLVFLVTGLVLGTVGTYTQYHLYGRYTSEEEVYSIVFRNGFLDAFTLILMIGIYTLLKYAGLRFLTNPESVEPRYRTVARDSLGALAVWFISMLLLIAAVAEPELTLGWGLLVPTGIALYSFAFIRLIPVSLEKKRPFLAYLQRIVLTLAIALPALFLLLTILTNNGELSLGMAFFITACHLLITAPLAWILFERYAKGKQELFVLTKELGQTHANFDFLRSQINPHFLFNALNTIYGTAIQENAERTSEGIERLGDMMRFMLQENMQATIPLAREVDYLNNYISLQKLRTEPSPSIQIQVEIQHPIRPMQIAPMLLIPFVENAFKHGISFREPSHIIISLELQGDTLHFDVHNSKHDRQGSDPEQHNNGIGLPNVRKRLQMLYPGQHDLLIRETSREFFVHLTLHLTEA